MTWAPKVFFKNPTSDCTLFLAIGAIKSRIFNSKFGVKKILHFNLSVFLIVLWSLKGCPNSVHLRYLFTRITKVQVTQFINKFVQELALKVNAAMIKLKIAFYKRVPISHAFRIYTWLGPPKEFLFCT